MAALELGASRITASGFPPLGTLPRAAPRPHNEHSVLWFAMAPLPTLRNGPPSALVAPVLALAAVGALVVVPLVALATIPLLLAVVMAAGGLLAVGLGLWALIEGLAAFERWLENDPRFQR